MRIRKYWVINSTDIDISCRTVDVSSSVSSGQSGNIIVNIDNNVYSNGNVQLEYIQPEFSRLFDSVYVGQVAMESLLQVQKDKNDPEEYMDMSGNDTLPPPVVTSQEPPNQTIQQTSDGECEVRTSDVDESHAYTPMLILIHQ